MPEIARGVSHRFGVKSRQADVYYRKFRIFRVYWYEPGAAYNIFKNILDSYLMPMKI